MLMAWDRSHTLVDRFHATRDVLDRVLPRRKRVGRTYQGFVAGLTRHGACLAESVQQHLRKTHDAIAKQYRFRYGWEAFAVDGVRVDCPRTAANKEHFGTTGKNNSGPQMLSTLLWHMGTGLPWAWRIGKLCESEQNHLRELYGLLPDRALLVADAAYAGFELLSDLARSGRFFLVRVGSNRTLLTELGYVEFEEHDTVYLWPRWPRAMRSQPPLVLRLICLHPPGKKHPIFLITNVVDHHLLRTEEAAMLYQMRWGIELFFRGLKQTLCRRVMRSHTPHRAVDELEWTVTGLLLLGMLSVSRLIARRIDPLRWSVASALRLVRAQMHRASGTMSQLLGQLGRTIKDTYRRRGRKATSSWPRQKNTRPPGPPTVRAATATEVAEAQQLVRQEVMV